MKKGGWPRARDAFPNAEMDRNDLPRRSLRQIFPRTWEVSPEGKREGSNDME